MSEFRELKLFEDTATQHGWIGELGSAKPVIQTKAYKDLFAGAGQPSSTLFKGMVALWATEKCYLLAWTYAKTHLPEQGASRHDVMRDIFIPNWSSTEFVAFVEVLENLVDDMADSVTSEDIKDAEEQWRQVLWAEEAFWPAVDS